MIALLFFLAVVVVMAAVFVFAPKYPPVGRHHTDYEPPPDPISPDCTRPEDLAVCSRCEGRGEIETPSSQAHGWSDPAYFDVMRCTWCEGSGIEPGYENSSDLNQQGREQ